MRRLNSLVLCSFYIIVTELCIRSLCLPQFDNSNEFSTDDDQLGVSPNNCGHTLNSPVVGLRSLKNPRNLYFLNETNIELAITIPELVLVCNATFPIEWVFSSNLGNDWNITELRYMIRVSEHVPTFLQRYSSELSLKPSASLKPQELVCRSVQDKRCLQTTATVTRNSARNFRNQSISVRILKSFPQGQEVPQFSHDLGLNSECSLHLEYNPLERIFWCFSKTENNLTLGPAANVGPDDCYDSFSCCTFFKKSKCPIRKKKLLNLEHQHFETTFPLDESQLLPGIVICKPEGKEDKISTAIQYFFALPNNVCDVEAEKLFPKLYLNNGDLNNGDLSGSPVDVNGFLKICPDLEESVYKDDYKLFSCISSIYLFATGVQMKLRRKNDVEDVLYPNYTLIDINSGYRNYSVDIKIDNFDIFAFECSVPLRKSEKWHSQSIQIRVKESSPISFEEGPALKNVYYTNPTILRCAASGNPTPKLSWTLDGSPEQAIPPGLVIKESQDSNGLQISRLFIPTNNASLYYSTAGLTLNCRADNDLTYVVKRFVLLPPDSEYNSLWYTWVVILPLGLTFVALLVGLLVWKILKQNRKLRLLTKAELDEFLFGRPEVLNSERSSSSYDVNTYATCLPYNRSYEVLKDQLQFDPNAILGSGAYGLVLKGLLIKKNPQEERIQVAIKTVKPLDDISYFKALMSELKIMGFIGQHQNIVNLVAAYTKNIQNREILIATEYCSNGNLLQYLRSHREGFINYITEGELSEVKFYRLTSSTTSISTLTLMRWALQIATGMDFLYHKKVIHGDIACRNILLSYSLTAKISDFGLSRQLFEYANYIKKHQSPLPWKWLALECLQDMKFSSKSDCWAMGVLCWELFTLGQVPFAGMRYNDEFLELLLEGKRPPRPQFATKEIYEVMYSCWHVVPDERPTFLQLKQFFAEKMRALVPEDYMDLEELTSNADFSLFNTPQSNNIDVSHFPCPDQTESFEMEMRTESRTRSIIKSIFLRK